MIAGLVLVFSYWDVDRLFYLGAALTILGPLISLGVVIRQRTPEAVLVFLLTLVAPVFLAVGRLPGREERELTPSWRATRRLDEAVQSSQRTSGGPVGQKDR